MKKHVQRPILFGLSTNGTKVESSVAHGRMGVRFPLGANNKVSHNMLMLWETHSKNFV